MIPGDGITTVKAARLRTPGETVVRLAGFLCCDRREIAPTPAGIAVAFAGWAGNAKEK